MCFEELVYLVVYTHILNVVDSAENRRSNFWSHVIKWNFTEFYLKLLSNYIYPQILKGRHKREVTSQLFYRKQRIIIVNVITA